MQQPPGMQGAPGMPGLPPQPLGPEVGLAAPGGELPGLAAPSAPSGGEASGSSGGGGGLWSWFTGGEDKVRRVLEGWCCGVGLVLGWQLLHRGCVHQVRCAAR